MFFSAVFSLILLLQCAEATLCPKGFVYNKGHCYWFSRKSVTASWIDAKGYCESMNAYLAILSSAEKDDFARNYVLKNGQAEMYWIGGNDIQAEGHFQWILPDNTSKDLTYTNWNARQPDNGAGKENCLQLNRRYKFKWNDENCANPKGFICEREAFCEK